MENTQKIIEDFFNEKIHEAISTGYEEIIKPIRDKKTNHEHRKKLEEFTKEDDDFESNQWMLGKLKKLAVLFDSDKNISELINRMINLYQENNKPDELKTEIAEKFKNLKKLVNKSQLSESHKKSFEKIQSEKRQTDKFKKNKRLLEKLAESDPNIVDAMIKAEKAVQTKFQRNTWINDAAQKASEVSVHMTHIAKLTHSSARASNIDATVLDKKLYQKLNRFPGDIYIFRKFPIKLKNPSKALVVTVNCSREIEKDFSYSSASYAQIAELLHLTGKIICLNPTFLEPYARDNKQLKEWREKFILAFHEKTKSSHILAKQIYFPLHSESNYHLLTPLASSSLAQVIYNHLLSTRRKDMPVREARTKNIYSTEIDSLFHNTAVLKITQTNHQNPSNLNNERSGKLVLLPAIPPQWQIQIKPPIYLKTIFNKQLAAQAKEPLAELKNLLLAIRANKLTVNLQRKQLIRSHITDIADVVFDYVSQIQGLKQYTGWTQESQLPAHQQYWLDPLKPDEEFQTAKVTLDWSSNVAIDFSKWINRYIRHKQLTLGMAHEKQWQKLFMPLLREFNAIADADIAISTMEKEA